MRITALGHAGFRVETAGATVLLDPWLSPEGAFQASWFQYPENHHLLTPELCRPTAIAVSHEHGDHIDPWFLAHVPASVPVVIPRYPSPVLRRKVLAGGARRVIEAEPYEEIEVAPGTRLFFVCEASPMNHDAAIVVCGDGHTFLDLNDARLFPMQFRAIRQAVGGTIDVFAFQGAGASWYPLVYDFPEERRRELSRQKRLAKFSYVARAMAAVEPTIGIPSAGPPCFLAPDLSAHNAEMRDGIFPDQQQLVDWLATEGIRNVALLLPGDTWDAATRMRDADPRWRDFAFGDPTYLEAYAARRQRDVAAVLARHPEPTQSLWDGFRDHFERLLAMSPYFNSRIDMRVGFVVEGPGGGEWSVDFRPGREVVADTLGDCAYVYRFASRWLPPILDGSVPWEDFLLSLRFTARRNPDRYNDHLLGLLKFAEPDALAAVEAFETALASDERMTVRCEGRTYTIGRHCPHAGNDLLETGEVLPGGILRCLAHHYDFDLATGECLNGHCPSLEVETVDGPAMPVAPRRAAR
jgi:UDP-MurNAc hydroxylase